MPDIECAWTPSFVILRAVSPAGEAWCRNQLDGYAEGLTMPVDHRYIADIVIGAREDGLTVDTTN